MGGMIIIPTLQMRNRGSEIQLRRNDTLIIHSRSVAQARGLREAPHLTTQAPPALAQTQVSTTCSLPSLSCREGGTDRLLGPRTCLS